MFLAPFPNKARCVYYFHNLKLRFQAHDKFLMFQETETLSLLWRNKLVKPAGTEHYTSRSLLASKQPGASSENRVKHMLCFHILEMDPHIFDKIGKKWPFNMEKLLINTDTYLIIIKNCNFILILTRHTFKAHDKYE